MNTPLPLEDNASDILGKAMRGLGVSPGELARRAGVSEHTVQELREGRGEEAAWRAVAPVLGLGPEALVVSAAASWRPEPLSVEGLACFNTPFEDMTVNSYLVFDAARQKAVAFDTGADATAMLDFLRERGLTLERVLLTHTHGDHLFDLDRLCEKTGAQAFTSIREPLLGATSIEPGYVFECGTLRISTRSTWGHSKGGITYVIEGLSRPVAVVGDALFAGSMGGGGVSYADALRTNREAIFSLPDATVVCPGHGPLTTVGEERTHNPFFAR
jgi:hydroxyacylglutathione hydrolase